MHAIKALFVALVLAVGLESPVMADASDDAATAYGKGDYATALLLLRPLANQGDAEVQSLLGFMYAEGQGVPQDYAAAVKWYRLAADQGDAEAQKLAREWKPK